MAGQYSGVQARILSVHDRAVFVHCSSHHLNLVVNDLCQLPMIRNTVGTVKSVIVFFRANSRRRGTLQNIPALCETRWTQKHKSVRIFCEKYNDVHAQLEYLSENSSSDI